MNTFFISILCISMLFSVEKKKGKIPDFSGFSKKIELKGLMEPNLEEFQKNAEFVQITSAGFIESHPHDINITKDSPNYRKINLK